MATSCRRGNLSANQQSIGSDLYHYHPKFPQEMILDYGEKRMCCLRGPMDAMVQSDGGKVKIGREKVGLVFPRE